MKLSENPYFVVGVIVLSLVVFGYFQRPTKTETEKIDYTVATGDLDGDFIKKKQDSASARMHLMSIKDSLLANGWTEKNIKDGQLPNCYNFKPQKSKIENFLEVRVGYTDVAIKVMNIRTDKCIRYVFINNNSTFKIKNIPEGKYYLKIAYGEDWLSKVENEKCIGRFLRNQLYEKGTDILDFNLNHSSEGYNIPSYRLMLDVVKTDSSKTFVSQGISESDFNN